MMDGKGDNPVTVRSVIAQTVALISRKERLSASCKGRLADLGRELTDAAGHSDYDNAEQIGAEIRAILNLWGEVREARTLAEIEEIEAFESNGK